MSRKYFHFVLSLSILLWSLPAFTQYCVPDFVFGTVSGTAINRVILEDIDYTSGAGNDWNDFTAISTTLTASTEYSLSLFNYDNGAFYAAWIDYNHDEEFSSDEKLGPEISIFGSNSEDLVFTTPDFVTPGPTRLRILCSSAMGWELFPCEDPDYYYGEVEDYTVIFVTGLQSDIGVYEIIAPVSGCGMDGNNEVSVIVKNYGFAQVGAGDFTVNYQITDPELGVLLVVTEDYNGVDLSTFESMQFTFSTSLNIASNGNYVINTWTTWNADEETWNDETNADFSNYVLITDFPYQEDFEAGTGGWFQAGINSSWQLGSPSGTVIDEAPPLTPGSLNSWTTSLVDTYNESEDSWLISPCFDFSGLTLPYLGFDIWWNTDPQWDGANMWYSLDEGLSWTLLGEVGSGQNWYTYEYIFAFPSIAGWEGEGQGWITAQHDLAFLAGMSSVKFGFNFQSNDDSFSFGDGIAIDNFFISDALANDLAVTSLIAPEPAAVEYSATSEVTVVVTNYGTSAQSNFNVAYRVNNGSVFSTLITESLNPGQNVEVSLPVYDFSLDGNYAFESWTELAGEMNYSNDTLETNIVNLPLQLGSGAYLVYSNSTGSEPFYGDEYEEDMDEIFSNFWEQEYFETLDPVAVFSENTCFVYLAGGFTHANELEVFLEDNLVIIESWVESGGHLIISCSPAEGDGLNLGFGGTAVIYPHYTYNGHVLDMSHPMFSGFYQPTSINYTGTFVARGRLEGDFIPIMEDLNDPGKILVAEKLWGAGKVLFASTDKYSEWNTNPEGYHMHLNMLNYLKVCGQVDVGALSLLDPQSGCGLDDEQLITVEINNYGLVDAFNTPVYYSINGGEASSGNVLYIPAGGSAEFTFPIATDMQSAGNYDVVIWTGFFGDADLNNDSINVAITSLATPLIELGEDLVVCDEYLLDAGNEGAIYEWSTDEFTQQITINESGLYSVEITDPNTLCSVADSVYITIENFPVASFDFVVDGGEVTFTNTSDGGTSFSWNFGNGFGSTSENPVQDYTEIGEYPVTVYVTNTCGTDSFTDTVIIEFIPDGINNEVLQLHEILMYPNPATTDIFISHGFNQTELITILIYDDHGKICSSERKMALAGESISIHCADMVSGTYLLEIQNLSGPVFHGHFVKQ